MNFWDGVIISSLFWFFVCGLCFLKGAAYGWNDFDMPRFNWSDGYTDGWIDGWHTGINKGLDDGYDAGFQAALSFDPEEVLADDENA